MTSPARFKVLRRHETHLSLTKVTYEVYDPQEHIVYLCYLSPRHPFDDIPLNPDESVADYLRTTSDTWVYEEPTEEQVNEFAERFWQPVRHICDPEFDCTVKDCDFCNLTEEGVDRFLAEDG